MKNCGKLFAFGKKPYLNYKRKLRVSVVKNVVSIGRDVVILRLAPLGDAVRNP